MKAKSLPEGATELARQIRILALKYDCSGDSLTKSKGDLNSYLASGYNAGDGGSKEKLASLRAYITDLEGVRERSEAELANLLSQARSVVAEALGPKPDSRSTGLLVFLDDGSESALVRCERAAEFIEEQAAASNK